MRCNSRLTVSPMLALCAALAVSAAFAGCSNTTSSGGGAGGGFFLPDAKGGLDGTGSGGTDNTGTGSGNDNTCGTCPNAANATATCNTGTCGYQCLPGFFDCDSKPANGCEIDSSSNPSHCGGCGQACGDVPNGSPTCINSQCGAACEPGWQVCKADPMVCDTNTDNDPTHCGTCDNECPTGPNASPRCTDGACELKCFPGWADCNKIVDDGCEINTANDPEHCGACGLKCESNQCIDSSCECASSTEEATLIPLDLFIMMDQSGSMGDTTGTGATKWTAVTQAVNGFMGDPASAGIGVGIGYFPIETGGFFSDTSCTVSDYAKPEVAIQVLPGASTAIKNSLAKHGPTGDTPTAPALKGAIQYAQTWAAKNPTHTVVVVFATDGDPTSCSPTDIPSIAKIAASAATGTPKILTFVIGVGSLLSNMNAIAKSGGTNAAFVVDTNGNVVSQFTAALKAIQGKAIGCQYNIPAPKNGQPVDYTKVNVQVTTGGVKTTLKYVSDPSKCDPVNGGWNYDDPTAPSKILLCDATCKAVSADDKAKVDIQLGCPRIGTGP